MNNEGGVKIGGVTTVPLKVANRFTMLLWGMPKCGKTTFASTAPGKLLWLNFDPDGLAPLIGRDDILVVDFSKESYTVINTMLRTGFDDIESILKEDESIRTVVLDSATSLRDTALYAAVKRQQAKSTGGKVDILTPGMKSYQETNGTVMQFVRRILVATARAERNFIVIAHEGEPDRDDEGNVMQITPMFGGQSKTGVPLNLSECWSMFDKGNARMIAVRPIRNRRPCGTRMFDVSDGTAGEFTWKYNPETGKGVTLASLFEEWQSAGHKIPLPT